MIYTSYFGHLRRLPENMVPVSICGRAPDWYTGYQYKKLAPKYDFFMEWKVNHDNNFYIREYNKRVLSQLQAKEVEQELYNLTGAEDIVLICYEKPNDFCHRHLVSDWFNSNGIFCKEI